MYIYIVYIGNNILIFLYILIHVSIFITMEITKRMSYKFICKSYTICPFHLNYKYFVTYNYIRWQISYYTETFRPNEYSHTSCILLWWILTEKLRKMLVWRKQIENFIVLTIPLDSCLTNWFDVSHTHVLLRISPWKKKTKSKLSVQLNQLSQNELTDTCCIFLWWILFWETKENIATEKLIWNFTVLTTPLDTSPSGTLISCLSQNDNFPMKNAKETLNYHFTWINSLKMSLWTHLKPFSDKYFMRN